MIGDDLYWGDPEDESNQDAIYVINWQDMNFVWKYK